MSLIRCPECESQVSDRAFACPQCGFPIQKDLKAASKAEKAKSEIQRETEEQSSAPPKNDPENHQLSSADVFQFDLENSSEDSARESDAHMPEASLNASGKGPPKDSDRVREYKGIGPWLRILCFFLILAPITDFFNLYGQIARIEATEEFTKFAYGNYALAGIRLLIGIGILSELRTAKTWATIKLTAVLIWIVWPLSTAIEWLVLPQVFLGGLIPFESGGLEVALGKIALSAGFAIVWTAYLMRSKRIAATYQKGSRETE